MKNFKWLGLVVVVVLAQLACGCAKKPSFTAEQGAGYIESFLSAKGVRFLQKTDRYVSGTGNDYLRVDKIISIREDRRPSKDFDERSYEVKLMVTQRITGTKEETYHLKLYKEGKEFSIGNSLDSPAYRQHFKYYDL